MLSIWQNWENQKSCADSLWKEHYTCLMDTINRTAYMEEARRLGRELLSKGYDPYRALATANVHFDLSRAHGLWPEAFTNEHSWPRSLSRDTWPIRSCTFFLRNKRAVWKKTQFHILHRLYWLSNSVLNYSLKILTWHPSEFVFAETYLLSRLQTWDIKSIVISYDHPS